MKVRVTYGKYEGLITTVLMDHPDFWFDEHQYTVINNDVLACNCEPLYTNKVGGRLL